MAGHCYRVTFAFILFFTGFLFFVAVGAIGFTAVTSYGLANDCGRAGGFVEWINTHDNNGVALTLPLPTSYTAAQATDSSNPLGLLARQCIATPEAKCSGYRSGALGFLSFVFATAILVFSIVVGVVGFRYDPTSSLGDDYAAGVQSYMLRHWSTLFLFTFPVTAVYTAIVYNEVANQAHRYQVLANPCGYEFGDVILYLVGAIWILVTLFYIFAVVFNQIMRGETPDAVQEKEALLKNEREMVDAGAPGFSSSMAHRNVYGSHDA